MEAKGVWAGLFALMGILSAFSNLGFEVWLTREVAAGTISRARAIHFLFKAKSGLWVLCLVLGAFWVHLQNYPPAMAFAFGFALVFEGIGLAEQAVFEGKSRTSQIALMTFLKTGGFVLIAFLFAFLTNPKNLTIFAWIFATVLLGRTLYGWRCWSLLPEQVTAPTTDAFKHFLIMGSYTFVTIVYFKVDLLMLGYMSGNETAGNYDNAYNFVEGALFLSAAASTILYPALVREEPDKRKGLFDGMFKILLALGLCGTVSLWTLGPFIGGFIIGDLFEGAVSPLRVLAIALPIMFANGLLSRWLFSERREGFALSTAAGAAIFNLLGNAWIIPKYGAAGAGLITVLTEGLLCLVWLFWGRKSKPLVAEVLLGFLILGVMAWTINRSSLPAIPGVFGMAGFAVLLLVRLKAFTERQGLQTGP